MKGAIHPVVRTIRARAAALYVASHASRIIDWPVPEGRLLLRDLIEHATQPLSPDEKLLLVSSDKSGIYNV